MTAVRPYHNPDGSVVMIRLPLCSCRAPRGPGGGVCGACAGAIPSGRYHLTAEQLAALEGAWDIEPPSEVTATETPRALADGKPRKRSGEYAVTLDSTRAEKVKP